MQQSGFTPGRSTCDRILTLCNIAQQRQTYGRSTYATYVDLRAALDSISRPALWLLLKRAGVPEDRNANQGFVRQVCYLRLRQQPPKYVVQDYVWGTTGVRNVSRLVCHIYWRDQSG